MRMPVEMELKKKQDEIMAHPVMHLPPVYEFALKLGIVETINQLILSRMDEDPGTVFPGMILDTLSGRSPLYRLDEFFENKDVEILPGKKVSPEAFKDYNVARVLDMAYVVGGMKIFTEISGRAVLMFDVDTSHVSFDTTSISAYGDYDRDVDGAGGVPFNIDCGFGKAHRPDL